MNGYLQSKTPLVSLDPGHLAPNKKLLSHSVCVHLTDQNIDKKVESDRSSSASYNLCVPKLRVRLRALLACNPQGFNPLLPLSLYTLCRDQNFYIRKPLPQPVLLLVVTVIAILSSSRHISCGFCHSSCCLPVTLFGIRWYTYFHAVRCTRMGGVEEVVLRQFTVSSHPAPLNLLVNSR